MNQVILIGRLTTDPSLSYTANSQTAVASFRLAVSRDTKEGGADFIQCKVFGVQAENLQKYKHKGDEIAVVGRIETGSYEKRDGTTVRTTEVICNRVEYTHGNKGGASDASRDMSVTSRDTSVTQERDMSQQRSAIEQEMQAELPDGFEQLEDEIPF